MQILASALPGFRDLRAPLTAGYLWLILLWLVVKPDLSARPTNELAAAMYDLGKGVGPLWVGLGISVVAYLAGSVSQSISQPMASTLDRVLNFGKKVRFDMTGVDVSDGRDDYIPIAQSELQEIQKLQSDAISKLIPYLATNNKREEIRIMQRDVRLRAQDAERGLSLELSMPATLLIGKEQELFSEADRLKAESQLRFSVVPPLVAIMIYLAIAQSYIWLLGAVPIAVLAFQGYLRNVEFRSLMFGAVQRGVIRSQSVEDFRLWVSNLPPDGHPPTAQR